MYSTRTSYLEEDGKQKVHFTAQKTCLMVFISAIIHKQRVNPFELHCPKRKSKIPRYNMTFTVFPLHFMLHLGILDYLISRIHFLIYLGILDYLLGQCTGSDYLQAVTVFLRP